MILWLRLLLTQEELIVLFAQRDHEYGYQHTERADGHRYLTSISMPIDVTFTSLANLRAKLVRQQSCSWGEEEQAEYSKRPKP